MGAGAMMNQIPPPPPGFVVQGAGNASPPPPPPGFELDQQPSTAMDMLRSGGAGLRSGIEGMLSQAGDLYNAAGRGAEWLAQKAGISPETVSNVGGEMRKMAQTSGILPLQVLASGPDSQQVRQASDSVLGNALKYQPQTTAGKYARTVAEFAPGALIPNGDAGLATRLLTQSVLPGLGSEAAGQMTAGTSLEPYARMAGAFAGGMVPSVVRRAITPFPSSPEREAMAQTLANEGVDLTAGQRTGSNMLRYAESELGGGAAQRMMENQGEQFTGAALRRAGIDAARATPEVIDDAFTRVGQQFDNLAARNTLVPDQQLIGDLRNTLGDYANLVPESARAPIVQNTIDDISNTILQNGAIDGQAYQSLSSRLARAARGTSDPELGNTLQNIRGALDDAMQRSIQANNPADAGAWQEARNQYRNLLTLEKAATGAGENAAAGIISPAQIRNAAVQQSRRAYARGQGDFADLARAGSGTMTPLPNSGTASRAAVRGAFSTLGGIAGGVGSGSFSGGALGALAGAAIPPLVGRGILSAPGRAYLGNQLAAGMTTVDPARAALIAALLGHHP